MTDADMSPDRQKLYERVVDVISGYDATPDERDAILQGTGNADSWADVPEDIRDMISRIERTPRQVWDDPADLPDQKNL
jgi:hypothetical protein